MVDEWRFRPDAISPRVLAVTLDERQYPERVTGVRLDIRWFVDGAYSFHYVECHEIDGWECRFDRHSKPDAPTAHSHPPPEASGTEPSPIDADHHLGVCFEVLAFVEERVDSFD